MHEKGGAESAISRPDLSASTFFFFGQRSEIISLVCLFIYFFAFPSWCHLLNPFSGVVSLKRNRSGKHVFGWKLLSCCWQQKKKTLVGGVFRSGTKQERDLSAITFVTKALYYQQWDQLNPAASSVPLDSVCERFRAILRCEQFGSRVHDAVTLREPRDISHPSVWKTWAVDAGKEGILTASPSILRCRLGWFCHHVAALWKSRPSLQLQG